jgi:hypothetical protein
MIDLILLNKTGTNLSLYENLLLFLELLNMKPLT